MPRQLEHNGLILVTIDEWPKICDLLEKHGYVLRQEAYGQKADYWTSDLKTHVTEYNQLGECYYLDPSLEFLFLQKD